VQTRTGVDEPLSLAVWPWLYGRVAVWPWLYGRVAVMAVAGMAVAGMAVLKRVLDHEEGNVLMKPLRDLPSHVPHER
jgi:hypothetical protein